MSKLPASNRWRRSPFFKRDRDRPKLAPLVRELSWSHNLRIMSRPRRDDGHEYVTLMAQSQEPA
jgi:hypothetical protein